MGVLQPYMGRISGCDGGLKLQCSTLSYSHVSFTRMEDGFACTILISISRAPSHTSTISQLGNAQGNTGTKESESEQ